ncbi:hypothetical protein HQN64_24430 [Enterobacteriaceae bacterium BIT-l23]|uniref:hypothetical protein n=1 Tax=Jejubacter sp. L23 TaxID=3092086 RepID=UPI00158493D4|nr:hypothetical protein [Enterobacteriaceae bacterium BIT-l23]
MNIDEVLHNFVDCFNNSPQSLGELKYTSTKLSGDKLALPLKGELLYFYEHLEMIDNPAFGGDLFLELISGQNLVKALSGWRWIGQNNNIDPNWSENYIIFANRNDDVIFCDIADGNSQVYGSVQKKNIKLADSLKDFLSVFHDLVKIEEIDFQCETTDDDFNYKLDYLERIERKSEEHLSDEYSKNMFHFFFG